MSLQRFREQIGLPEPETERSLWVIAEDRPGLEAIVPVLERLEAETARLRLIISAPAELLDWIGQRLPGARTVAAPFPLGPAALSWLYRSNINAALFVDPSGDPPRAWLEALDKRAVALAIGSGRGAALLRPGPELSRRAELAFVVGEAGEDGTAPMSADTAAQEIRRLLGRDLKPLRRSLLRRLGLGPKLVAMARSHAGAQALAWRLRILGSLEDLRRELNAPRTILCLGNGPSSEHPELQGLAYDRLFRVNHGWMARQLFDRPDVVFTGSSSTMRALREPIFGLQTRDAEERFAAIRCLNPRFGRSRLFNVNEVAPGLGAFDWRGARPSNGAAMVAVAVALQPARLVVAGIDLFRHPEGSYPGDAGTPNAYAPGHNSEAELDFLLATLAHFRGDLVIIGEVLRAEWERYRKSAENAPA